MANYDISTKMTDIKSENSDKNLIPLNSCESDVKIVNQLSLTSGFTINDTLSSKKLTNSAAYKVENPSAILSIKRDHKCTSLSIMDPHSLNNEVLIPINVNKIERHANQSSKKAIIRLSDVDGDFLLSITDPDSSSNEVQIPLNRLNNLAIPADTENVGIKAAVPFHKKTTVDSSEKETFLVKDDIMTSNEKNIKHQNSFSPTVTYEIPDIKYHYEGKPVVPDMDQPKIEQKFVSMLIDDFEFPSVNAIFEPVSSPLESSICRYGFFSTTNIGTGSIVSEIKGVHCVTFYNRSFHLKWI